MTTMTIILRAAMFCALGAAHTVCAQTYTPTEAAARHLTAFEYPVLPTPGIYQDFGQRGSGRGWAVDTVRAGANVIFFGAFYHYAPDGKATWNTHQANITQASVAEYTVDGLPAYVRGPMYVGQNGPCIDCPMVTSSLITAYPERVMKVWGARACSSSSRTARRR